jgi:hypothetical protein
MSFFPRDVSRGRAGIRPALVLAAVLVGGSIASAATAGDTDRLANCVATANMARDAAKSHEGNVSSDRTLAIIAKQKPKIVKSRNSADPELYSDNDNLTPDEAAAKVLHRCFESDVL